VTSGGIELAVSLYSFTQRFVEREDYQVEDMFRTLEQLGVRQFEIVGSQVFDHYPRPGAGEVDRVLAAAAAHGCTPFSYGGYIDSGRISGHIPTDEDVVLDLTADLMTARDLGCRYLRAGNVPEHLPELTAQLAENYGVSIGTEVHAPSRPSDEDIQRLLTRYEDIGSSRLGFIPDFGCFIERPAQPAIQRLLTMGARQDLLDYIIANRHSGVSELQMQDDVHARGGGNAERAAIAEFFGFLSFGPADLDGFRTLLPWSHYFHSKFYYVAEDLTDQQIPVDKLLTDIAASGFEGVLMSEYEGHAFHLDDAEEQVARHLQLERRILSSVA
jgi:deglycosylation enzyme subunit DgpC